MSTDKNPNEPISKEEWNEARAAFEAMIAHQEHPKDDLEAAKRLPEARPGTKCSLYCPTWAEPDWIFSFMDDDGKMKEIAWANGHWVKVRVWK